MKKILITTAFFAIVACGTKKVSGEKPLYEVLTQQNYGGANIRFNEIVTEEKEIPMLLNDEHLKRKVKREDIKTANFLILNMGDQSSGGYSVTVDKVEETADKIIITIKENTPSSGAPATMAVTNPYTVVRINSKKPIEIRP